MKVLCLHGRGSNNEIFKLQTASLRAHLPDFTFEFVQGTVLHTEGNWSLFTTSFSQHPLYHYYDSLSAKSIFQTENEIMKLIDQEGPFDGVIGYSGGATLASQLLIRHAQKNPFSLPHERVFRWAVFINGGTPLDAFRLSDVKVLDGAVCESEPAKEAAAILLRPSNIRVRKGTERHPEYDSKKIQETIAALQTRQLADGRLCMTDGTFGVSRYSMAAQGILIDIPTLHVRSATAENIHWGLELLKLCEPLLVREVFHDHDHDFPRGRVEIQKIAEMIRETAETV